ncbi:MAG: hypothetical protein M3619_17860, partial [Myxococcota bacterium]|nr:hypothetical protein [Myxococcota bacterium]
MLRPLLVACVALVIGAAPAHAAELPRYGGLYTAANQPLPMLDSKVTVSVRGPIIEVVVTQRFTNRTDQAIEATYVFPLPPDAAVSAMSIKTGTKTIRGAIAKRDEAQRRYEEAVRAGVTAALTDQERPDVFTQTVAGIAPRGTVEITLRYDAMAHFYDGAWAFAVPMVVAPRYVPGVATARPTTGTGRAPDTDRAPDASRVTPAGSPGAGGATQVTIRFVDKVWDVTSPTHELAVAGPQATFTDPRSDHDAVIRWKAAPASGWVEHGPEGGFAAVVVGSTPVPPRKGALRCLLVLDRSATSRGDADAIAQPLVRQLLGGMSASDRIAVTGSEALAWSPPADVLRALDQSWHRATGPFDLTRVLQAARPDGAPIVIITSALVADDRAALVAAKKLGVPIHVIGVGPAPARGLLTQLATVTGGTVRFALPGDDLPAIARSVVADAASPPPPLAVSWGTLAAREVVPGALPRLGSGQAMLVLARVDRAATANGRAAGAVFAIEPLAAAPAIAGSITPVGPLARRWARSRLDELLAGPPNPAAVTELALKFGLVSPYTSMVAIGEDIVVHGGTRRSVAVPVSVPSGMKWQQVKKEITVDLSTTTRVDDDADRDRERDVRAGKRKPARQPIAAGPAPTRPEPAPPARP